MYSVFCAFAAVFVVMAVPETKGRDLDSIANLFVKKSKGSTKLPIIITTTADKTHFHPINANGTT